MFLFIAILGSIVSYAQIDQPYNIGGSKVPGGTDPIGIGGKGSSDPIGQIVSIVNQKGKTDCFFATLEDIGGKGTGSGDTGQFGDDDFDPFDIGGGKSSDGGLGSFYGFIDIGGNGSTGGGKGTSSDTGQVNDPADLDPYDIGGRGSVGTGEYVFYDIGGKNTPGDLSSGGLGTNPFDTSDDDTGGRGTEIGVGQFVMNSLEYTPGKGCDIDTGGRDSGTGLIVESLFDISGGKSSDTGTGLLTLLDTGGKNGQGTSSDPGQVNPNGMIPYDIGGRGGSDTGTGLLTLLDTGGRNGQGTSTGGDYDDDDDTGGKNSNGGIGEMNESGLWLSSNFN